MDSAAESATSAPAHGDRPLTPAPWRSRALRAAAIAAGILLMATLAMLNGSAIRTTGPSQWPDLALGTLATVVPAGANPHLLPPQDLTGVDCGACHTLPRHAASAVDLRASVKETCLQCHPQQQRQLTDLSTHPPFNTGECTACHLQHPPAQAAAHPALLKAEISDLCLTCHADKRQQQGLAFVHRPFGNGQCTSCHDPHGSSTEPVLKAPNNELCFTCHRGVAQSLSLPVQHPPFQQGNCTTCHEPHASDQAGQLRTTTKELCFSCHAGPIARMNMQHKPVQEGWCPSCHQPHAGQYDTLLRAPGNELCLSCHRK